MEIVILRMKAKDYDVAKTEILESYKLKVMRFTNDGVLNNLESVCQRIEELIPPTPLFKGGLIF